MFHKRENPGEKMGVFLIFQFSDFQDFLHLAYYPPRFDPECTPSLPTTQIAPPK